MTGAGMSPVLARQLRFDVANVRARATWAEPANTAPLVLADPHQRLDRAFGIARGGTHRARDRPRLLGHDRRPWCTVRAFRRYRSSRAPR